MRDAETLDKLVVALCRDYQRRREAIAASAYTARTLMEYRYYNLKIFDGAAEVVGKDAAEKYITEIGEAKGYANSEIHEVSEYAYKKKKSNVKRNIAVKLHLTD